MMDTLRQTWAQFSALFATFSPGQRATLLAVPLLVLGGFGVLLWGDRTSSDVALSWGKLFSTEELISAEQALIQAQLTDFRREGQRIMVPASMQDRYNAALVEAGALPADLGSELLRQMENLGPFTTDRQRQDMKEAMLLQELRRTLRAIPDLQDARVVIANPPRRSPWGPRGRVTASVTVTPRSGRELSPRLITSIRAAVAGMVPDLKSSDVTVFDMGSQMTHTGEAADDPLSSQVVQRIRELTREYEQQIQKDLAYIPEVGVTVHVDIENVKSSVVRTQQIDPKKTAAILTQENTITDVQQQRPPRGEGGQVANRPASLSGGGAGERSRQLNESDTQTLNGVSFEVTEKELLAAMPSSVQVSVNVPRDYYRNVAAARQAAGEQDATRIDVAAIEKEVVATVQKSVQRLIPANSPVDAITVSSIDLIPQNNELPALPITTQTMEWLREYGGTVLLVLVTLWVVRAVRKSLPASAPVAAAAGAVNNELELRKKLERAAAGAAEPVEQGAPATQRERLQTLVRDNPETTAAVIGKWLQAAR